MEKGEDLRPDQAKLSGGRKNKNIEDFEMHVIAICDRAPESHRKKASPSSSGPLTGEAELAGTLTRGIGEETIGELLYNDGGKLDGLDSGDAPDSVIRLSRQTVLAPY